MLNKYVISTHNWYEAQKFRDILDAVIGEKRYLTYSWVRRFESHSGEEDYRNYWSYKAYVNKDEENMIRQLMRRAMAVPNWTIQDYYR